MKKWKRLILRYPRSYLFSCWLLIGLAGRALGAGAEATVSGILFVGYFFNIIWMMHLSE